MAFTESYQSRICFRYLLPKGKPIFRKIGCILEIPVTESYQNGIFLPKRLLPSSERYQNGNPESVEDTKRMVSAPPPLRLDNPCETRWPTTQILALTRLLSRVVPTHTHILTSVRKANDLHIFSLADTPLTQNEPTPQNKSVRVRERS
jgi:hypothetical protein